MSEKMDKSDMQQKLCAYLDGELSESASAELERQLAASPQMQTELRNYAEINKQLAEMGEDHLPGIDTDAQCEQIMGALERQTLLGRRRRRLSLRPVVRVLSVAAVVGIVATAAWLIFQPSPRQQQAQVVVAKVVHPPQPTGEAILAVEYPRLEWSLQSLNTPRTAMPPGTIVVSIGIEDEDALSAGMPLPTGI